MLLSAEASGTIHEMESNIVYGYPKVEKRFWFRAFLN